MHKLIVNKVLITKDERFSEQLPVKEVNRYRLLYEFARITKDQGSLMNDDRINAVALGVHDWTEETVRDAKREKCRCR
jgi:hypothetical protein